MLKRAIENHPNLVARLEKSDLDGDGKINIDGFKAALLVPATQQFVQPEEIEEVFNLICDNDGFLRYAGWIADNFHASLREQFEI